MSVYTIHQQQAERHLSWLDCLGRHAHSAEACSFRASGMADMREEAGGHRVSKSFEYVR